MAKSESKKPNRLPKDFNHMKPDDRQITDPDRADAEAAGVPVDVEYPKHLHKYVGPGLIHDFVEVGNAKDEAAKRREGWMSPQEADAVGRAAEDEAAPKKVAGKKAAAPKVTKAKKTATAKPATPAKKAAAAPSAPARH